jgi:hypothetical protein
VLRNPLCTNAKVIAQIGESFYTPITGHKALKSSIELAGINATNGALGCP